MHFSSNYSSINAVKLSYCIAGLLLNQAFFIPEFHFSIIESWKEDAEIHPAVSLLIAIHTQLKF